MSDRHLRQLFGDKVRKINEIRKTVGPYVTYLEDKTMRQQKWETEYSNNRLIMWDNTYVLLCFKPADAEAHRNTYSAYYGGNVGKGAVFIQPCGWMGTHELWMGAVSDTEYMLQSKVFDQQEIFIKQRDPLYSHILWLNMLDRGYRNLGDYAWNKGGQMIVQPNFARSDGRFTSYDTLQSASVAAICAGNELAVKNIKASKYISTGLQSNESCKRVCEVWLCWGFQINYMYKPVH
jgi:hypothetical protein